MTLAEVSIMDVDLISHEKSFKHKAHNQYKCSIVPNHRPLQRDDIMWQRTENSMKSSKKSEDDLILVDHLTTQSKQKQLLTS